MDLQRQRNAHTHLHHGQSHTETGNCSGGKATSTEKAICETCHTAYGELLQPAKTVITTPPTLPLPGYVGNEYTDRALQGGEAKAESTGVVVPGTFRSGTMRAAEYTRVKTAW